MQKIIISPIRFMLNVIKFRGTSCAYAIKTLLQELQKSLEETPSFFHEKKPGKPWLCQNSY